MKKLVIFDVDGIICDFEGGLVSVLEKQFGAIGYANRNLFKLENRFPDRPDVLRFAKDLVEDPNFYYGLQANEGVADFIDNLQESGVMVMYLSSRPLSSENFTRRWLLKNTYGQVDVYCGVSDKAGFLNEIRDSVDFVVEDNPEQIEKMKKSGFSVLCFDQEWNKGIFPRLYVRSDGNMMLWASEDIEAEPFWDTQVTGDLT